MIKILKNYNWTIISSFSCIFLGIITFLTFINEGFIPLNEQNLQILLVIDIILLSVFFYLIFRNFLRLYNAGKRNKKGSQTNLKYISLFSLFTFIPSLLIAIFSLFIFNFGIQNYFDQQITKAVNNSYDVAKNYLEDSRETVKSDVVLMSLGLNRASNLFYSNPRSFNRVLKAEKMLRRIDDVYLIDSKGNVLTSDLLNPDSEFIVPTEQNFDDALNGSTVVISNNLENKTSVMIKLSSLVDTYLYISRDIDTDILRYLNETEQAVGFYYSVENSQTGIKITFAIIYIIVVTLLLFLSTALAITFATRLTKPIINLIGASEDISKGILSTKVPEIETDDEFKVLINNFNNMIDKLKQQQEKLLTAERYSAWETVARKLAHEIKNPLTPIQLSIDRLREKYAKKIIDGSEEFEKYLQTINRQIKDIEKLANEFSSFARMPRPIMKKINIEDLVSRSFNLAKISTTNNLELKSAKKKLFVNGDEEQLNRVFLNLIKNSEESILEKASKKQKFKGKIIVEITSKNQYIDITVTDNGTGISDLKKVMNPYFTTKSNGTGLGLPIVNKIINEHSGELQIKNNPNNEGATTIVSLPQKNA